MSDFEITKIQRAPNNPGKSLITVRTSQHGHNGDAGYTKNISFLANFPAEELWKAKQENDNSSHLKFHLKFIYLDTNGDGKPEVEVFRDEKYEPFSQIVAIEYPKDGPSHTQGVWLDSIGNKTTLDKVNKDLKQFYP